MSQNHQKPWSSLNLGPGIAAQLWACKDRTPHLEGQHPSPQIAAPLTSKGSSSPLLPAPCYFHQVFQSALFWVHQGSHSYPIVHIFLVILSLVRGFKVDVGGCGPLLKFWILAENFGKSSSFLWFPSAGCFGINALSLIFS